MSLLKEQCERFGVSIWAYCFMPNQVHLIAVPKDEHGLASAIGETHRRYTVYINQKMDWRGHLFQDRFFSYAADDQMILRAARFIETLPVTAGIAPKADSYLWSSARSHIRLKEDPLVKNSPLPSFVAEWGQYLDRPMDPRELELIQTHLQTGRPRGSDSFLDDIEKMIGRTVRPQRRGRKPKWKQVA